MDMADAQRSWFFNAFCFTSKTSSLAANEIFCLFVSIFALGTAGDITDPDLVRLRSPSP